MQVNRDYLQARGGFPYRNPFADDRIEIHGAEGGVLFDRNGDGIKTGAGRVDAVTSLPALVSNGVYWQFTNPVTLTDAAKQLPEVSGQSFLNGATARRQQALMARQRQLVRPIAKLERLSGNPVVPVRNNGVTLGNGAEIGLTSSGKDATQKYAFVRVSQHQIDLLEQSYEQFKKASYIERFKQTRLDRYNDRILITVSNQGEVALNFSSINALIDSRYKSNSTETLAGLIELLRYFGPALAVTGWNGFDRLRTRVTAAQGKAATIRRLAAAQGDALKQWAYLSTKVLL